MSKLRAKVTEYGHCMEEVWHYIWSLKHYQEQFSSTKRGIASEFCVVWFQNDN